MKRKRKNLSLCARTSMHGLASSATTGRFDQITYLSLNINFSITPVRSSYQKPMVFNRVHGFLQLTLGTCYVCPGPSCSCKHTLLRAIAHAFQRLHVIGLCPLAFGRFRTDRYTPCPCNNASTTSLFFFGFPVSKFL
jgi:hypothetical protein